ncbi:nitrite reductase [Paenibacillus antri]|uniref:Nitrite reductase n=1 Tax=Paenibacillus antri TaxID=2582848 RepID=A0A5R9GIA1_9BACL|nr:nitrite reductase [Paenibacillus antri]TLS51255.1 nitrite reductase [Paenibacillus antri]
MEGERVKIAVSPAIQVGGSLFTPEQFALIGSLADGGASIEMTPFGQLYVETAAERLDDIRSALQRAGLQVLPAGFAAKGLIACNFCKGAEDAGLEIARELNRRIAGLATPTPVKVGYAGCALGTSEPLLKDIGVVKMRDTFDIYVGGEPKGLKASLAQPLVSGIEAERVASAVRAIIDYYTANAKGKEKFRKFVDRVSLDAIREKVREVFQ